MHQIGSWVSKPSRLCIKRAPGVVVCPRSFALVRQMSLILCACTTDGLLEWSYTPDSSRLCVTLAPLQNPNQNAYQPEFLPEAIPLPLQWSWKLTTAVAVVELAFLKGALVHPRVEEKKLTEE